MATSDNRCRELVDRFYRLLAFERIFQAADGVLNFAFYFVCLGLLLTSSTGGNNEPGDGCAIPSGHSDGDDDGDRDRNDRRQRLHERRRRQRALRRQHRRLPP